MSDAKKRRVGLWQNLALILLTLAPFGLFWALEHGQTVPAILFFMLIVAGMILTILVG